MEERLQNILSHAGVASRRHAEQLIKEGRVCVDGVCIQTPYTRFEPTAVQIMLDGKPISSTAEKHRTIMLNKPVGVISSLLDPFGGTTVADLLRGKVLERLVPVGRLDKESEGLLIMSNDGALTNHLTHPRYDHEKTYLVKVAGHWSEEKLATLRGPVTMRDGYVTHPCPVRVLRLGRDHTHLLEFRLKEGRKRQIREMCSAAHLVVLRLKRTAVGRLQLPKDLAPGAWRDLTPQELQLLTH